MTTRETRTAGSVEPRAADKGAKIGGYAATFGTSTIICDCFEEVIAPGAFDVSLKRGDDVVALFNHDANFLLGRTASKTLVVAEDEKGLTFEVTPPDAGWAKDLVVSVARGDVSTCSFAFIATREEWDETGNIPKRTILQADLYDVSVVTRAAYDGTSASLRMFEARSKAVDPSAGAALAAARLRMKHAQFERGIR